MEKSNLRLQIVNESKFLTYGISADKDYYKYYTKNYNKLLDIKNSLRLLGFDLRLRKVKPSNGRIQYDYYTKPLLKLFPSWSTYTNGKLAMGSISVPILDIHAIIKNHFFRKYKKSSTSRKIKDVSPRLDSYDQKILETFHEKNFLTLGTWSLPQRKHSDILCIDIDESNGLEYFGKLKKLLGAKELLLEKSPLGRVHCYFKCTEILTNSDLSKIQKVLKTKITDNLDVRTFDNNMRLPSSHSYRCGRILNGKFKPYKKENWYKIVKLLYPTIEMVNASLLKIESVKVETVLPTLESPYIRNSSKIPTFTQNSKDNAFNNLMTGFPFGLATRNYTTSRICSFALLQGFTFDEFFQAVLNNNDGSSKDIMSWSPEQHKKSCQHTWDSMSKKFKPEFAVSSIELDPDYFCSNLEYIKNPKLKKAIKQLHYKIFHNHIKKHVLSDNVKFHIYEEYNRALLILLKEIIGFILFDEKNKRSWNKNSGIKYYKFLEISIGYQFSRSYLSKLKKNYNISIDIRKLFNVIINDSIFKQYFSNTRGYCNIKGSNHCKQFLLKFKDRFLSLEGNIIYNINKYLGIVKRGKELIVKRVIDSSPFNYNMCQLDLENISCEPKINRIFNKGSPLVDSYG